MVWPTSARVVRALGFHEFKRGRFYRDLLSEVVGTMILVFVSCALSAHWEGKHPSIVQISLAAGICIATIVWCLANASGSHINPAISIAFAIAGHITPVRALCYSISQCLGALLAVVFAKALTPATLIGPYFAVNRINPLLTPGQGVGMEAVCTFLLTFTVFATVDQSRHDLHGSGPLAIGFSVLLTHLFGFQYTGSAMNPARSLGPAIVAGKWEHHWVYWVGPIIGSIVGVLFYQYVIAGDATFDKVKAAVFCNDSYVTKSNKKRAVSLKIKRVRRPSLMAHFEDEHYAERNHENDVFYPIKHDDDEKCDHMIETTEMGSNGTAAEA